MSNRKLVGTEFRNEFLRSLNVLAPRIAAAIEKYGEDTVDVINFASSGTATLNNVSITGLTDIVSDATTEDVLDITADSLTTANVIDISADALTTGTILNLVSDSSDNSSRTLLKVLNDNSSATGTSAASFETHAVQTCVSIHNDNTETDFGPILTVNRKSSTVADDMGVGIINFQGLTDGSTSTGFARISAEASDVSDATPRGKLILRAQLNIDGSEPNAVEELMSLGGGTGSNAPEVVINDLSYDVDFRVESNGETHMLFVDGGNNRVSIGDSTDTPAATLEISNASNGGVPLVLLDSNDTDKICLDIDAANIDADVIDIAADAVTTAFVMDVTADGLTTGGILNLVSDSSDTSDRTLVKVTNDNTGATGTTIMHLKSDAVTDDNPILLIESSAADTGPVLELRNTNAGVNREAILKFTRSDTSAEADDMDLGRLQFQGADSGNNDTIYVAILAEASDVTDGDEGGLLKFRLFSGGTGGTASSNTLFSIGGEDVANSTPCEVIVNEDGIDCNFRVESDNNTHMLFVDAADDTVTVGGDVALHKDGFAVINNYQATTFENTLADGRFGSAEILRYSPGADDTLTAGQLFFLHTDGTWDSTDADAVATGATQMLGIGLGGSSQTVGCLIKGFIRIPSTEILNLPGSGACDGLPLYVSTTAGHLDFTAPSGNGDFVRTVGYAIDDDGGDVLIYFNPDATHVEITA